MLLTVSGVSADVDIQKLLTSVRVEEWLREDLFRFKWWFLLGLSTFLVVVWWKLIDKKRLPEIMLYAVLTTTLTMGIVEYGEELTLWDYPTRYIPNISGSDGYQSSYPAHGLLADLPALSNLEAFCTRRHNNNLFIVLCF